MALSRSIKVKICCISNIEEANIAIKAGAHALGLVGPMPSGPGIIDNKEIKFITQKLPAGVSSFLLTSEPSATKIIEHYNKVHTSTIQLVDSLKKGSYEEIKNSLPHVKLVQVIHVQSEDSIEEALICAEHVDALLLDSGNPNKDIKELGGTGRTQDWSISKKIVDQCPIPVFLAGGLNPSNVREAIDTVNPFGVDLCSGVRTNGHLDEDKLRRFFEAVHGVQL